MVRVTYERTQMEATSTILVKRDIREVFTFIADPLNQDKWVEGVSDTRLLSDGGVAKGATYEFKITCDGRTHDMVSEVTLYDPPRAFGVRSRQGPYPFHSMLTLLSDRDGTIVSNTIDAEADGLLTSLMFTLFGPWVKRSFSKQLRRELETLKAQLEAS